MVVQCSLALILMVLCTSPASALQTRESMLQVKKRNSEVETLPNGGDVDDFDDVENQRPEWQEGVAFVAAKDRRMEPHMFPREKQLLFSLLDNATYYQEFGSGGSTVAALKRKNIKKVHTVESAKRWINKLSRRNDISAAISSGRLKLVHADIGPTADWGYPKNDAHREKWPDYSGKAAEQHQWLEDPVHFDLVFVDGRFRVACLLKALQRVPEAQRGNVKFAMHDYTDRLDKYQAVEKFVKRVHEVKRLVVFQPLASIDEDELQAFIEEYQYIQS